MEEIKNPPETEDPKSVAEEMRKLNQSFEQTRAKLADIQERQRQNQVEVSRQQREIDDAVAGLRRLDDVAHQKLDALARWDRDAADTVRWLRSNRHHFKMEVLEPLCGPNRVAFLRCATQGFLQALQ
jgi:structural maintenance of chromosomes protein 5